MLARFLVITWNAVDGSTYRLQFTDELKKPNWNDASPDMLATGFSATATNTIGTSVQRFYRVLLVH